MVFVGLAAAFALGFFNMPWWTVIFAAIVIFLGIYRMDAVRAARATGGGNPLLLIWGALPAFGLWWLGSLF